MNIEIVSPEGKIFTGSAKAIQLPGTNGLFQILDSHAPMISTLKAGQLKLDITNTNSEGLERFQKLNTGQYVFNIKGGVAEVLDNKVIVLID